MFSGVCRENDFCSTKCLNTIFFDGIKTPRIRKGIGSKGKRCDPSKKIQRVWLLHARIFPLGVIATAASAFPYPIRCLTRRLLRLLASPQRIQIEKMIGRHRRSRAGQCTYS